MSYLGEDLINIIIQYKGVLIAIILITIGKQLLLIIIILYLVRLFKKYFSENLHYNKEYISMTKEEQKIYKLTQCNTLLNRDLLDKRDIYLKNVELDYKDIYGIKGVKCCNKMQNCSKTTPKKNCKVQFSNNIEYSRN